MQPTSAGFFGGKGVSGILDAGCAVRALGWQPCD